GREQSRRPGEVLAEVEQLARDGVREITLLGQNVNSYGRDLLPRIRTDFGELLRACDAVDGIERIRFTSPHPKDFRRPVIEAMTAQVPEELKRDRIERLVEVVQRVAGARNRERIGRTEEVLVEGPSRTDETVLRGRTRRNTTVNFTGVASAGELVSVQIEAAT